MVLCQDQASETHLLSQADTWWIQNDLKYMISTGHPPVLLVSWSLWTPGGTPYQEGPQESTADTTPAGVTQHHWLLSAAKPAPKVDSDYKVAPQLLPVEIVPSPSPEKANLPWHSEPKQSQNQSAVQ